MARGGIWPRGGGPPVADHRGLRPRPAKLLFDEGAGFAVFQSEATSQALLETLREASGAGEGDVLVVLNLTRPEYAQQGVAAHERLAFLMDQRARSIEALLGR